MGQSYFIWNGVDCRSKGILLAGPVPIVRPEERVQHTQIPGRSGDLTELEGTDVYNSYIQTATILLRGGYRSREIFTWLKGSGTVTFSAEPDRTQEARIVGAVTLQRHSTNLDWWVGEVQFYCQPLKRRLIEPTITVERNGTLYNSGDVIEHPIITVTTTLNTVRVTAGGNSLVISQAVEIGSQMIIDCAAKYVCSADRTTDLTAYTSGLWPQLYVGNNILSGAGFNPAVIQRRERFF